MLVSLPAPTRPAPTRFLGYPLPQAHHTHPSLSISQPARVVRLPPNLLKVHPTLPGKAEFGRLHPQ